MFSKQLPSVGGPRGANGNFTVGEMDSGDPPPDSVDIYYFHNDHRGTPWFMTDTSRTVVWRGDYYPFGEIYDEVVAGATNEHRLPGQVRDGNTGLYHNWHRYYDPQLGRYYQADPIGLNGRDYNLYRYASANPLLRIDPDGRILEDIWDDPTERAYGIEKAVTYCEFLEYVGGKDYREVIQEFDPDNPRSELWADGPKEKYRYVIDPANPKQVIDMRHFLLAGRFGEIPGLVNEIKQSIIGDRSSAFNAQDFLSNTLGRVFFLEYFKVIRWYQPGGFYDALEEFFEDRAKEGYKCR